MPGKIKEFLSEAEKHPSSTYYTLMADILLWQRKSDEAVASALDARSRSIQGPVRLQANEPGAGPQRARGGRPGLPRCRVARRSAVRAIPRFPGGPHRFQHGAVRRRRRIPRKGHSGRAFYRLHQAPASVPAYGRSRPSRPHQRGGCRWTELEAIENESGFRRCTSFRSRRTPTSSACGRPGQGRPAGLSLRPGAKPAHRRRSARSSSGTAPRAPSRARPAYRDVRGRRRACIRRLVIFVRRRQQDRRDFICTLDVEVEVPCAAILRNPGGTPRGRTNTSWCCRPYRHLEFSRVK